MQPKVSVIVPIYNVEEYIEKCLDSLINQTLKEIEIICINDCSPDNCLEIIKEYREKDNRIKLINHEINKGVSVARNNGMNMAIGEYLGFCDPDDYVDLDFFELLYNKAIEKNSDIVKGRTNIYVNGKPRYESNELIKKNKIYYATCFFSAIYRTAFIRDNNILFPKNIVRAEDIVFLVKSIVSSETFLVVDEAIYNYVRNENSADSDILNCNKIESTIIATELIISYINSVKNLDKKNYNILFKAIYFNLLLSFDRTFNNKMKQILAENILKFYKLSKYKKEFLNSLSKLDYNLRYYLENDDSEVLKKYWNNRFVKYEIELVFLNIIPIIEIKKNVNVFKIKIIKFLDFFKIKTKNGKKFFYIFGIPFFYLRKN